MKRNLKHDDVRCCILLSKIPVADHQAPPISQNNFEYINHGLLRKGLIFSS